MPKLRLRPRNIAETGNERELGFDEAVKAAFGQPCEALAFRNDIRRARHQSSVLCQGVAGSIFAILLTAPAGPVRRFASRE
jgi:hypothetical protein